MPNGSRPLNILRVAVAAPIRIFEGEWRKLWLYVAGALISLSLSPAVISAELPTLDQFKQMAQDTEAWAHNSWYPPTHPQGPGKGTCLHAAINNGAENMLRFERPSNVVTTSWLQPTVPDGFDGNWKGIYGPHQQQAHAVFQGEVRGAPSWKFWNKSSKQAFISWGETFDDLDSVYKNFPMMPGSRVDRSQDLVEFVQGNIESGWYYRAPEPPTGRTYQSNVSCAPVTDCDGCSPHLTKAFESRSGGSILNRIGGTTSRIATVTGKITGYADAAGTLIDVAEKLERDGYSNSMTDLAHDVTGLRLDRSRNYHTPGPPPKWPDSIGAWGDEVRDFSRQMANGVYDSWRRRLNYVSNKWNRIPGFTGEDANVWGIQP